MSSVGPNHCKQEDCFFPSTSCGAGFMDVSQCAHYRHDADQDSTDLTTNDERFPWTGRPFGLKDLRCLTAAKQPRVIGVAGLANAGKTTLLGMLFLMIYRGYQVYNGADFAGSFTLQGWENIARHLQHTGDGPIRFPPHTTQSGRYPGLLHLRFAVNGKRIHDYLLSDGPGEWFSYWTDNAEAETAAGARWIAANADKLMIIADTEALTGPQSGPARTNLEFLMRRVQRDFRNNAVALVWSKTDLPRPDELVSNVNAHFERCFAGAPILSVKIPDKSEHADASSLEALRTLFQWAFADVPEKIVLDWPLCEDMDPFLSYRGCP